MVEETLLSRFGPILLEMDMATGRAATLSNPLKRQLARQVIIKI
jgi:hypothetical protein